MPTLVALFAAAALATIGFAILAAWLTPSKPDREL